jgi:hypothetical protein
MSRSRNSRRGSSFYRGPAKCKCVGRCCDCGSYGYRLRMGERFAAAEVAEADLRRDGYDWDDWDDWDDYEGECFCGDGDDVCQHCLSALPAQPLTVALLELL